MEEKAVEGRSALGLFKIVTQHRLAVEIFRDYVRPTHISIVLYIVLMIDNHCDNNTAMRV